MKPDHKTKLRIVPAAIMAAIVLSGYPGLRIPAGVQNGADAWIEIGPAGGDVVGLARNSLATNELYAAAYAYPGPFFKSSNNGASWVKTASFPGFPHDVAADSGDPNLVYILSVDRLMKSSDRGASFAASMLPGSFRGSKGRVAAGPSGLFIAGYSVDASWRSRLTVLRSVDGGATWTTTAFGAFVGTAGATGLAVSPQDPMTVYVSGWVFDTKTAMTTGRVYRSANGGRTWKDVTPPFLRTGRDTPASALALDPENKNKVYLASPFGVARSSNGGASWLKQTAPAAFHPGSLAVDAANPKVLYAQSQLLSDPSCYKSVNGGLTWKKTVNGVQGIGRRILASGKRVLVASSAGVFSSGNSGASFKLSGTGMTAARIRAFALSAASGTMFAAVQDGPFLKTADGGAAWSFCTVPFRGRFIDSCEVSPSDPKAVAVLATGTDYTEDLFRSADGGRTWKAVLHKDLEGFAVDPRNPDRMIAAGKTWVGGRYVSEVHLTSNAGKTWTSMKITAGNGAGASFAAFDPLKAGVIYVGGESLSGAPLVVKTLNNGASWAQVRGPFQNDLRPIAVDPSDSKIIYVGGLGGLWKSADGGAAWTRSGPAEFWGADAVAVNPLRSSEIFVQSGWGVFSSPDGGATWTGLSTGLPVNATSGLAVDGAARAVYVGTDGGGVCKRMF